MGVAMAASRRFVFLGTGTSTGVPSLGCHCEVCTSTDPRNRRYRCAAVIETPRGNILIDTPPDLRTELLQAKIDLIHSVIYTHYHADHLFGLDDLRQFPKHIGGAMPVWCAEDVETVIRRTFPYIFSGNNDPAVNWVPKLDFHRIRHSEAFHVLGELIRPVPLVHAQFPVLGFRIGDVAYCTDVNRIPDASWPMLRDLKVLIIDALRRRPHPAHFGLQEALDVISQLKPEQAYLTHISHDLDHEATNKQLPAHVRMAYDGLAFEF